MAITTIPVSKEFHDWLKSKGKKGESYEDVIKRLLGQEYQQEPKEELQQEHAEEPQQEPKEEQPDNADDIGSIDNL